MVPEILDKKTVLLLAELRKNTEVEFEIKKIDYAMCYFKNNRAIIYYDPEKIEVESIAHELLHVWLKEFKYTTGNHIYLSCTSDPKLKKIFSKGLCDHIGNCCDHLKMYPEYLNMGYSPEKFLTNSLDEQCSISDIKRLKLKNAMFYDAKSIDAFIGYLISIYADHMPRDYSIHIEEMKMINIELFNIVTSFWNDWKSFDIKNIDPIFNSEHDLLNSFIGNLEDWINTKILI